jgi:aldehyde dehydrogenase (NAD+)
MLDIATARASRADADAILPRKENVMTTTQTDFATKGLFINGEWHAGTHEPELKVINPATEEVIAVVPQAGVAETDLAIEAARRAFDHGPWPRMHPRERSAYMLRMTEVMERRRSELYDLELAETGAAHPINEANMVNFPLAVFRDYAQRITPELKLESPMAPFSWDGTGLGQGVVVREPIGVAGLIAAFNFPMPLSVFKCGPALAAGCTMVLKPSPFTPLSALFVAEAAEEADLPPGVLNVVVGDVPVGERMTRSAKVDVVSFTGSDVVGRKVYAQAAETLKRVVLELGGKSANIICDDADLERAVMAVVGNMTMHAGQGCSLLTRTLVHRSRFDELIDLLRAALAGFVIGNPADRTTTLGPLMNAAQLNRVERYVELGKAEGGEVVIGGKRPEHLERGFFYEPTVFVKVDNSMRIAREEIFGPVEVVIPFDTDDEAIAIANDSDYGLGGGVWAKDPGRAYKIAKAMRTGYIDINGGGAPLSPHGPFGGYKSSGVGREWGDFGVAEFMEVKSIAWSAASG